MHPRNYISIMLITKLLSYVKSICFVRRTLTNTQTPSTYSSRVSFDTFDNRDAPELSYVLTHKHKDFASSKRSRLFLCGTDQNDYSDFALEWLLDELVDDGDEVVCFRVVDKDSKINSDISLEQRRYKEEAHKLMEHIKSKNKDHEKSINLVLEFAVGKVQESIQSLVCCPYHRNTTQILLGILSTTNAFLDCSVLTRLPRRRHSRQVSWWYSRSTTWIHIKVLSPKFPRPCHCRPSVRETRQEEAETSCGSQQKVLPRYA